MDIIQLCENAPTQIVKLHCDIKVLDARKLLLQYNAETVLTHIVWHFKVLDFNNFYHICCIHEFHESYFNFEVWSESEVKKMSLLLLPGNIFFRNIFHLIFCQLSRWWQIFLMCFLGEFLGFLTEVYYSNTA